ncbi:hypothetical protein [Kitasatospora viridis]|uniref:Uncharacterized protein n=1 Tax=Kitasatospora viridis TaxID=281105 RepID=A0A561UGR2_9ACTN|nr:hypothetical protein [Kitasatospora viridis]TWF98536.1 hypothetical protein FHX73_112352 [Kitasatospora viridis]
MTQPSTADAVIPAPRTRPVPAPAAPVLRAEPAPAQPTGWAAVRRGLAVVRGLRSLATVPARPQPGYGEVDGQ